MTFDFRKEYKEFYMPKNKPEIVIVPKANYIASEARTIQTNKMGHISKQSACYMLSHTL